MDEKCAICGATENIQKHHTSYEPEIIQLLCVDCHKAKHNHGVGKAPGWTPLFEWLKADAEILFKEGATNKKVAKACDISYATASHWRKKLGRGLPKHMGKPEKSRYIQQDVEERMTLLGISGERERSKFINDTLREELGRKEKKIIK